MTRLLAAILAFCVTSAPLLAHDFWMEPSTWTPNAGELVSIRFRSGDAFRGEPVVRNSERLVRFTASTDESELPVRGVDGGDPAGVLRATEAPCTVVSYEGNTRAVELSAERFARYAAEEGLETQLATMPRRTVTDRYSRSSVLLLGGPRPCGTITSAANLELQIVPDADPSRVGEVSFTLLFRSAPAPRIAVVAYSKSAPHAQQRVVTDERGRATVRFDARGPWLIKAVRIAEEKPGEYRSHWASLTFSR